MVDFSQSNGLDNLLSSKKKQPLVDPIVNSQKPLTSGLDDKLSSTAQGWNLNYSSTANPIEQAGGIVFVDAGVQDYQTLVAGLKPGTEVAALDPTRNAIEQIGQYLAGRTGISSVHIISHGESGSLQLGGTKLGLDNLNDYASEIQHWRGALKPGGDILLYGCDVAEGEKGKTFVQKLSQLTGADVAASDDLTGNARLGGDWDLEFDTGKIDSSEISVAAYNNVLQTFTVSNTNNDGADSLRDAITQANTLAGLDTINFDTNVFGNPQAPITIALSSGELSITDNLTIQGTGANNLTISGGGNSRVFNITAADVTLDGLTIADGYVVNNFSGGGGILYNNNSGTLNVKNSVISNNRTNDRYFFPGTEGGGGISNSGTLNVTNSTISGNQANGWDGGGGISNSGTLNVTNSTISGNQANGWDGGGIAQYGTATLTNVTITNNTAGGDAGGIYNSGTVNVKNTIIAGNTDSTNGGPNYPDISGTFISQGNNLIGSSDGGSGFTDSTNGDIVGTNATSKDAKLGSLQNNGGSTPTHALLADSPAINAGNNTGAPEYDQRGNGFARLKGGTIDIGAFESDFLPPPQPPVITLSSDPLRYDENGSPTAIDSTAILSDPDSTDYKGGSLKVAFTQDATAQQNSSTQPVATDNDILNIATQGTASISVSNGVISYNNTEIGSFAGGTGSTPLVITFNSENDVTKEAVAALLQNITYRNTSENPPASRTVSFELTEADGTTKSTAVSKTINIIPQNDNPTLTLTPGTTPPQPDPLTYTEQANAIAIDNQATVTDPDFGTPATNNDFSNFTNGTLTVRFTAGGAPEDVLGISGTTNLTVDNNKINYNQQEIGSFARGTNNQDLVITFTQNANPEAVQTLLRNISYSNTSDNPSATRTVSFELTDGDGGTSGTKTKTINVTPVNDPVSVALSNSTPISYTENAPPIPIDNQATVADVDYNRLNGSLNGGNLTVRFTAGGAAEDRLGIGVNGVYTDNIRVNLNRIITSNGTNIGSFTGGTDGVTPLVISFNNNATPEAAQALLRNITYSNISNAPSTGDRTVSFVLTEGDGTTKSTQVNKTISVRPVNDPASVTLSNSTPISYTENDPATAIDNQATVSDIDSGNFNNGTLTVKFSQNGSAGDVLGIPGTAGGITVVDNKISYNQQEIGTFTGGTNNQDLVIRFNVNASPTAAQALLRNISYSNTSDNPSILQRTVSFELAEADGTRSTLVNKSISVTPVNDAPNITLSDQPLSYTENATAIAIDSTASVSDPDSNDFNSGRLTVQFTNGATTYDVLRIASQDTGISVSDGSITYQGNRIATFEGGTNSQDLVIDFNSGFATPAAAQALLRSITYSNTSNNPSASRTVQFTLTDGDEGTSTAATKIINVTPVNDAPTITGLSNQPLSYTENDPATIIDSAATVADVDSANFDGGTLTVQFTEDSAADGDLLAIRNQGNNGIGVSNNNNIITYNGTEIGTFTGGITYTNTFFPDKAAFEQTIAQPLVITFNSDNATPEAAQALLRNITYSNSSENPITAPRTVSFRLSDGNGGTSDIASKRINVTAVNDAPSVTLSTGALSYTENDSAKLIDSAATVADVDSANFNSGRLTVQFTENGSAGDVLAIASPENGDITVTQSNISYQGSPIAMFEGGTNGSTPLVITFNSDNATPQAAQALLRNITYSNSSDNSPATRTVSFTLSDGDGGTSQVVNKTINVRPVNDSPELVNEIPNQTAPEDAVFNFQVPASTFTDVDGDTLTYTAKLADNNPLPSWLTFNQATGTFSGTPTNENVGALNIKVTATDSSNRSVSDIFELTVTNTNDAPTVVASNNIASQIAAKPNASTATQATEDQEFNLVLTNDIFSDVDAGDSLTITATQENSAPLPNWLTFTQDAQTLTFSGTPTNDNVGALNIRVTATDSSGASNNSVSDTFAITVGNVNDQPVVSNAIADRKTKQDDPFSFTVPENTFSDVDKADTLSYSATLENGDPLPDWLQFDSTNRTFTGTPTNENVGSLNIKLTATDKSNATASDIFAITVENVNDKPEVSNAIADQSATEDQNFNLQLTNNIFSDVDKGDQLTITATQADGTELPDWLTFTQDANNLTFSGTPTNENVGSLDIKLTATDSSNATTSETFAITVGNTNDQPVVSNAIADRKTKQDDPFSFTVPENTFSDVDKADTLSYSATLENGDPLPDWLQFDSTNRTFTGTPTNENVGSLNIKLTATDKSNATASDIFAITVENVNDKPEVVNPIADQSATEDEAFSFSVPSDAFGDVDAQDTLSYTATLANGEQLPEWLSFDGTTFNGTPSNENVGSLDILVTATDSSEDQATASDTFAINVANTNDAPQVSNAIADQSATEDEAFSFSVPSNAFTDVDGDNLTYTATLANGEQLPEWLSFDGTTFNGTPSNENVGSLDILVTATDSSEDQATASDTFAITVGNVNDQPVVSNAIADQSATEDEAFSFSVPSDAFGDVDAQDTLSYTATLANGEQLPEWLSFDGTTFNGTPSNENVGSLDILVTATDSSEDQATASDTFAINVANTNDAPQVSNAIADQSATEDEAFSFSVPSNAFTDVDGDNLTYTATLANGEQLPEWLSFDGTTFNGTPSNENVGSLDILVTATDSSEDQATASDTFAITVANTNDDPTVVASNSIANQLAANPDATNATEDQNFNLQLTNNIFSDVDNADRLTITATQANGEALPEWLTFAQDAQNLSFSGTPLNENVGSLDILITATDLSNATASDSLTINVANVNDAPVFDPNAIAPQQATEDQAFSFTLPNNAFSDVDAQDTFTIAAENLPEWLTYDAASSTFAGTPANEDVTTQPITIGLSATDSNGATVNGSFDLNVANVNDAPVFAENVIAPQQATEDQEFTFNVPSNAFTDADGDTLTIAASENLPEWLEYNQETSTFAGTPANEDVTTQPITIGLSATDSSGEIANGSFELNVANVNDAPVFDPNAIAPQQATEDQAFSFTLPNNAFSDVDAQDTFTIAAENLPEWLTYDAASSTFAGTPANEDVTTQPITIGLSATDSNGATVNGSFDLNVANVNDAPVFNTSAIADQSATEDQAFSFTVPTNAFGDVDAQDTLTYSATLANGEELPDWLDFDDTNLTFSGTPLNEDVGSLDILVTATDRSSATASDTFAINVENVNDAPVANIDQFQTDRAEPITISSANLLRNDTDVDDDSLSISTFSQPENGTLVDNNDDTFTYTPDIYFQGADSFTYTVNDGNGGTATNSVDLTVNPTAGVFNQVQRDEFLQNGQNESTNINSLSFDEGFYLEQYPDVAQAVKAGIVKSGFDHFERYGKAEGRKSSTLFEALVFDEGFYLKQNPDVAQAVKAGIVKSGFDHFERYGKAEGRSPSILFDEAYYLEQNPDVAQAVRNRVVSSGFDHFERYGEAEGRNPSRLFDNSRYLADNSDVAQAVENGVISSGFDHYVRYGQFEGRQPNLQLFDESYYLANNPDVAQAVQAGIVRSGFDHFVRYGEAEGRNPSSLFDNNRYLAENPDVAQAVQAGIVRSACDHFIRYGKAEGRSAIG